MGTSIAINKKQLPDMSGDVFLGEKDCPQEVDFQDFVCALVVTHGIAVCEFALVGSLTWLSV